MRKTWLSMMLLAALALSACSQQAATPVTEQPTATAAALQPSEAAEAPTAAAPATCKPFKLIDLLLPEGEPAFPEVQADEWVQGPADARLTLVVYSDFQ